MIRKLIGKILGTEAPGEREWPTVALTALAREWGAGVVRVHAVKPNKDAMRMAEAIMRAG